MNQTKTAAAVVQAAMVVRAAKAQRDAITAQCDNMIFAANLCVQNAMRDFEEACKIDATARQGK